MLPFLPFEVIKHILAQVEDGQTFHRCALVCRAWRSTAQTLMFGTIAVVAMRARKQHEPQYHVAVPHQWNERLRACPHLVPLIRNVVLGVSGDGDRQPRPDVLYQFMTRIAPDLPNLRELTVFGHNTAISAHRIFLPRMRKLRLPGIKALSVKHVAVEDTNQFGLWFLFPFSNLVDLRLQDVAWCRTPGQFEPDATTKGRRLPRIKRLSLCYGPPLRRSERSSASRLEIKGMWTLRWILRLLCASLVQLEIDCGQYDVIVPTISEMVEFAVEYKDCPTARIRPPWYTTPHLEQLDLHLRFAMRIQHTKGGGWVTHVPSDKAKRLANQWNDGEGVDTLRPPEHLERIADVLAGFDAPRLHRVRMTISRGDWITIPNVEEANAAIEGWERYGKEKRKRVREAEAHLMCLEQLDRSLRDLLLRPEGTPFPTLKKIDLDPNFYPDLSESLRLHRMFTEGLPLLVEEGLLEIAPCRAAPPLIWGAGP